MTGDLQGERRDPFDGITRLGLLGDTHGDFQHLILAAATLRRRGVTTFAVLGDWGFLWPGENWPRTLDRLSRRLAGQTMLFLDGNHEWHPRLADFPVGADGIRWLRPNIGHLPRGWRTTLGNGLVIAALGGAASIDSHLRVEGRDWWPEEMITEADLTALGPVHVDVLLGHDAPSPLPKLDTFLATTAHHWPDASLAYADESRRMLTRALEAVTPSHYLGGHYHHFVQDTWAGARGTCTLVTLLDCDGPNTVSVGILDLADLSVEALTRTGVPR